MRIKDADGNTVNATGQGQGNLNTVLGAVGTAGALGMLGNGLGLFGNRGRNDEGDRPVTRYEMGLIRESLAKDNEIALLKAKQYTDERVNAAERRQCEINTQQAVFNGTTLSTLQCIQGQVAQLQSMTRLVIPNGNVAPGWGPVTVLPTDAVAKAATPATTSNNGQ